MARPARIAWLTSTTILLAAGHAYAEEVELCELSGVERSSVNSGQCIACHDGSIASHALFSSGAGDGSHAVEIDYEQTRLGSNWLVPGAELPSALILSGGRITCATCHDGASAEPHRTALPMIGSAMCFGCHAL
ncbi:MAG: hypothetical protein HYZ28_12685 [Myxococcales bacterium]|nr:hypothetical protein [Myxococcales bacterium]